MENNIQYLAIIKPDRWVMSDTMRMKIRCKREYGWDSSPPHFTVLDIIQPASNEERLIKCFERNVSNISTFQINVCGFDYFSRSTYTLYVKLKEEKEFSEMAKYIKKFLKPILKSVKYYPPHYNTKNAHLTIAKGIPEFEFLKAWSRWENVEYESSTIANSILLLRRPFASVNFRYDVIGEYPFLQTGPLDTQMSLF
ncbi:hypothetical protein EOD41_05320 [Mucilaginibacter limnophilus]|uniref:2'-5' RNA ligase family protein n=1 Tax=Mucilaginibacter limnophilus TaxID=1932778 RepID=A0A3S2V2B5_9SPHI|nr:2'-5' RNA ligase family protein [Mucilaginibacter limnophilus]RVU01385.1 hypothetical protein EOD41_05320 [Mucilaginibacter limnophilus]